MRFLNCLVLTVLLLVSSSTATRHRRHYGAGGHQVSNKQRHEEKSEAEPTIHITNPKKSTIPNDLVGDDDDDDDDGSDSSSTLSSWLSTPELSIVRRLYDDCQDTNDFIGCLKQKALAALSRALEKDSIKIADGLVLEKQNYTEPESLISSIADARTWSSLTSLDRSLLAKIDKLTRTHTLKMDMSAGRDKKKKKEGKGGIKYVIAALVTAMGIAGPIGLKALAAIAIKALVISKVALTIAGIIALKKLFSHDNHEETSFQVHAGDHNRRSTYVIRPVPKASAVPALTATGGTMDPYRYYYEYHQ